jgi:hypothetical protein
MVMPDIDARSDPGHFREEDWVDFARGGGDVARRAYVAGHLEAGCPQCEQTLRLWTAVLSVADQEAAVRPPEAARLRPRPPLTLRWPKGLGERMGARVALVFDSFRQPQLAGVRATGMSPRQLLYKAGRYTIKVQVESGSASDRLSIVGQILDDQDPAGVLRNIAVLALKGSTTLDSTLTNQTGEFHLEPDATEKLQLSVDVPEIGTFTVQPPRWTGKGSRNAGGKATDGSGRGKKARPR